MCIVTLASLGDFTKYRCAFYRVYIPSKGRSSREPVVVVTNLGPLAVAVANALALHGNVSEDSFLMVLWAPITLSTVLESSSMDALMKLLNTPKELAKKLLNELICSTKACRDESKNFLAEKRRDDEKSVTIFVTWLENLEDESVYTFVGEDRELPLILVKRCRIAFEKLIHSKERIEIADSGSFVGWITLGLVPLTGSFTVGKGLALFREATRDDIEIFGDVVAATYLRVLRVALNIGLEKLGIRGELRFLVDTTHGLNNATVTMSRVIREALPLVRYEMMKHGVNNIEILFYNSDPALGLGPTHQQALQRTYDSNLSYYFVVETPGSLKHVAKMIEKLALDACTKTEQEDENLCRVLQGIYLISYGLIPWGLYTIKLATEHFAKHSLLTFETGFNEKKNLLNVCYRTSASSEQFLRELALWISRLAKECVEKLSEHVEGPRVNCWQGLVDDSRVVCYDVRELKKIVSSSTQNEWEKTFVNELLEDVARVLLEHELEEWIENPFSRIRYQLPPTFDLRETPREQRCSEILREPIAMKIRRNEEEYNLYCLTPMKVQEKVRNVIAHAGLTSVHRGIAFVFEESSSSNKCKLAYICIATPFPFDELVKTLRIRS